MSQSLKGSHSAEHIYGFVGLSNCSVEHVLHDMACDFSAGLPASHLPEEISAKVSVAAGERGDGEGLHVK